METYAVETTGLTKGFGDVQALDGLDLAVAQGSVFGLLGPNGAGKTTTIRILTTLLLPVGGSARVLGHDVVKDGGAVRRRVGLTGQFASVDADMTGHENLILVARLAGLARTEARVRSRELLDVFDLGEAANRSVTTYSGGMRRRLDIAASLVAAPDVLFLDEPTTGLDPHSRIQVWEIVQLLVEGGTTIVLTTQYLEEADRLADRIAVIDDGLKVAEGSASELKASVGSATLRLTVRDREQRQEAKRLLRDGLAAEVYVTDDSEALAVAVADPALATAAIASLHNAAISVSDFALDRPSLDEVFLALTGHHAEGIREETSHEESAA